jgi:hypothetical protein
VKTAIVFLATMLASTAAYASDEVPAPHVVAGEHGHAHVRMDADVLYGIGGQSFLGAGVDVIVDGAVWNTARATGTLGGGLGLVYHNEPTFLAPWIDREQVHGATHRMQALAIAAHTIHIGKQRRFSLGLRVHGGWNHWRSDYRVDYAREQLAGRTVIERDTFVVGGQLDLGYRVARRVGIHAQLGGPFPTKSSYINGMFQVGLGLTFYLR